MGISYKALVASDAAPVSKAARIAAITIALAGLDTPAQAFNTYHATIADQPPLLLSLSDRDSVPIAKGPSSSTADSCLPLLKSFHHTPISAMDRNQRSAGQAAALGLVFGLRFALSPPKRPGSSETPTAKARLDFWQSEGAFAGDRHALAVSAYRRCQKDKALQAIGDLRWAR